MKKFKILFFILIAIKSFGQLTEMPLIKNKITFNFKPNDSIKLKFENTEKTTEKIKIITDSFSEKYIVFIKNISNIEIKLNTIDNSTLEIILEALNENNEWKPVEYIEYPWCGNSYFDHTFKPQSFIKITSGKYNGDFETKLRYKLKNYNDIYYSNIFVGKINKLQFIKKHLSDKEKAYELAT